MKRLLVALLLAACSSLFAGSAFAQVKPEDAIKYRKGVYAVIGWNFRPMAAMVKGATQPCESANGEYQERQGLADYQALGYVPFDSDTNVRNANSIYSEPGSVWGSAATTLEYAVDDFAIAQFAARSLGDRATYAAFMRRSANWRRLYNPASGMIEPRFASGAFPTPYDNLSGGGFVEGDSAQYTWMVPQDPGGLFRRMGGRAKAASRLDRFLRELNGGPGATHTDHALLGNEPNRSVECRGVSVLQQRHRCLRSTRTTREDAPSEPSVVAF